MNKEEETEENIVIEGEVSDFQLQEEVVVPPPSGSRGKKRAAVENIGNPTPSRRRTVARDVLPIDDESHQYFPCPVSACDAIYQNRAERSFHLRQEHPGYKYKDGDGAEKIRVFSQALSHRRNSRGQVEEEVLSEDDEEEEEQFELLEQEVITNDDLNYDHKPPAITPTKALNHEVQRNFSVVQRQVVSEDMEDGKNEEWRRMGDTEVKVDQDDLDYSEADELSCGRTSRCSTSRGAAGPSGIVRDEDMFRKNILLGPRRRGRPRNAPGSEPAPNSKVRVPDPTGKYRCYIPDCNWRGGYRSIRAEHMKWCHKDWKQPPRYILQRLSQADSSSSFWEGEKHFEGELTCFIEGCNWRGIYRASRSAHMRSAHPEYQPLKKKAPMGGYIPDGKYECHDPNCCWRGGSRSTRASHMKREHPGFLNPLYQPRMIMCTDCTAQCITHKTFVDHLVCEHRIGGTVQREFSDIRDYEEWYEAVQDSFSVDFIKKMGVKQTESYQVLYLYCARSNGCRPKKAKADPYIPMYSKNRNLTKPFRTRNHCAAFLRVVHWNDGKLTVVGCVEHTGHRLGTALLRLAPCERELLDEYLYVHDELSELECMIERLRDIEGYVADGYEAIPRTPEEISSFVMNQESQLASLRMLLASAVIPPDSTFNVNIPQDGEQADQSFSIGIMTEDMRNLWKGHGRRAICFEEVRLMINNWDVSLIFVLSFDENWIPRCCCLYMSQNSDRMAVLRHLHSVDPRPIETLVTDAAPEWPEMIEKVYGEAAYNFDLQIAEWHLLPEWANMLDQMVPNRVDRFTILCCLRRWLRAADPALFEAMIIDMFEAFRELEVDLLSQTIDSQLSDPDFSKRWSPMNRNPYTEHANPTLEIACRMFREKFLNCDMCTRIDEYIGLLFQRLREFNNCAISEVYHTGTIEAPRQIPIYDVVDPSSVLADGTLIMQQPHSSMVFASDASGRPILIDEKNQVISVGEVEELVEEVEEEEIVMDMAELHAEEMPSTSAMPMRIMVSTSADEPQMTPPKTEKDGQEERRQKLQEMMEALKKKMDSLTGERDMDLLESQLSQLVEQLDESPQEPPPPSPQTAE